MQLANWKKIFDSQYYRILQTKNDTTKEAKFIIKKLQLKKIDNILDIGCGNGRHLNYLYSKGYINSTGIDLSNTFIKKAKKINKNIDLIAGDFLNHQFTKKFDKIYSFFTGFGYYTDEDNEIYISKVAKILKVQGIFLLDLFNYSYFIHSYKKEIQFKREKYLMTNKNNFDVKTSINHVKNIIIDRQTAHKIIYKYSLRYYTAPEIISLLKNNYLKVTNIYGNYQGSKFDIGSKRMILIATKIN